LDEIYSLVVNWEPRFLQTNGAVNVEPQELPEGFRSAMRIAGGAKGTNEVMKFKTDQPASFVTTARSAARNWRTDCSIDTQQPDGRRNRLDPRRVGDVIPVPANIGAFKVVWDALFMETTLNEAEWHSGAHTRPADHSKNEIVELTLSEAEANANV
jgi:hypothetical protein